MPYSQVTPEVAWAAGIYEGEGCAWTSTYMRGRNGTEQRTFGLSITSTDRDVLDRFAAIIGGPGGVYGPKNPGNRPGTRPIYQWMTQRKHEVCRVLVLLHPMLCERRATKADELLALIGA